MPPSTRTFSAHRYYAEQSAVTDPGRWSVWFDGLPGAVPDLVRVVQGLIIHPVAVERHGLPLDPATPEQVRFVADTLQQIVHRSNAPLSIARQLRLRRYLALAFAWPESDFAPRLTQLAGLTFFES